MTTSEVLTVRLLGACLVAVSCSGTLALAQVGIHNTFDQERVAQAPTGFTLLAMRQPSAGRWTVQRQGADGYLVHHADPQMTAGGYALAVRDQVVQPNSTVSTRLRFASGVRQAGIAWRVQGAEDFNALILDLDRQDLALYRVAAGNRVRLDVEDELELDPNAWHTLKVSHEDTEIRVSLGGIRVFEERDRRDARASAEPARVGLIASGQAEVWFDDFRTEPRGRR